MIHAFKLVTNESSSSVASGHNNSKGAAGAGGKKKHAQPAPLPKLEVQVVPLFSIAHDRKVNALACVFSPHTTVAAECSSTAAVVPAIASPANEVPPPPAIEEAATAVAVVDSMEPTSMTAETTAAEAAVKVIAATAGIEDKVPAFPASAPAQLPSDTNTAVAPMGMQCRCYVADTSNDITVYMRTF